MKDVSDLIKDKLKSLFPEIEIHREDIGGGFTTPSFFVQNPRMTVTPKLFYQQIRNYNCDIVYFPPEEKQKWECEKMIEQLVEGFQTIDGIAKLFNREFEVLESEPPNAELHFSFSLELHVKSSVTENFNQDLDYKGGLK